jgi:hypothetical protein
MTSHSEELAGVIAHRDSADDKRPLARLALGASLGALLAVLTLLGDARNSDLDNAAVASVNGSRLELAEYQRAVQLFSSEKQFAVTPADQSLILERMIEEELLVQYGVASGLVRDSQAVRAEVLRSVMAGLVTELEARAVEGDDGYQQGLARDNHLQQYLEHLRNGATIRWAVSGVER